MRIESVSDGYNDKMAGAYANSLVDLAEWDWLSSCIKEAIQVVKDELALTDVSTQAGVNKVCKMQGYIRALYQVLAMPSSTAAYYIHKQGTSGEPDDPGELPDIPRGL